MNRREFIATPLLALPMEGDLGVYATSSQWIEHPIAPHRCEVDRHVVLIKWLRGECEEGKLRGPATMVCNVDGEGWRVVHGEMMSLRPFGSELTFPILGGVTLRFD